VRYGSGDGSLLKRNDLNVSVSLFPKMNCPPFDTQQSMKRPVGRPRSERGRTLVNEPKSLMPSTQKRPLTNPMHIWMPAVVPMVPMLNPHFMKLSKPLVASPLGMKVVNGIGAPVAMQQATRQPTPKSRNTAFSLEQQSPHIKPAVAKKTTNMKKKSQLPRSIPLNKVCQNELCSKYACWGYSGEKPQWCKLHAKGGCIDVVSRRCESPGCKKHPAFARQGDRARFCKQHAPEHFVDVINKRCDSAGCNKHRVFAFPGERPRWCKMHSPEGSVDMKSRKCAHAGCSRHPAFAARSGGRAELCRQHARPGMVNVKQRPRAATGDGGGATDGEGGAVAVSRTPSSSSLKSEGGGSSGSSSGGEGTGSPPLGMKEQINGLFSDSYKIPRVSPQLHTKLLSIAAAGDSGQGQACKAPFGGYECVTLPLSTEMGASSKTEKSNQQATTKIVVEDGAAPLADNQASALDLLVQATMLVDHKKCF